MDPLKAISHDSSLPADLEHELSRQILHSEKLRAGIQAIVGAVLSVIIAIIGVAQLFQGHDLPAYKWAVIIGAAAVIYELITRKIFDYYLRHNREPPALGRYLNAAIETSIPTIVIIAFMKTMDANVALTSGAVLTYYFFIILSALRLDFWLSAFTGVVAGVSYAGLVIWCLDELRNGLTDVPERVAGYILRPIFLLLGGIVAGLVAKQIRAGVVRSMRAAEERRQIVQMFGQHVSPAVVDQLLAHPADQHSQLREVCILVLDIRNFTGFSEAAAPAAAVALLNRLWGFSVDIVNRHQGIVNKFLGDGFMAVFGAPISIGNSCQSALNSAREILAEVERASDAGEMPMIRVGIGIHAGEALVGNIGSLERREYTVIGDVVNVAFRIEQLNKELGSKLLISEQVQQATGAAAPTEAPASLQVRGRQTAVQVYKLA
jgi:adenylate cyclase